MADELDELFSMFPEGTRIVIQDGKVTFENMTPELLDVALSLNPDDENLRQRRDGGADKKNSRNDLTITERLCKKAPALG